MSKTTTKMAIAFAFKELLLEKPLDKITVNDIAEKCEMNRQTFYYHFHDILELTEWICEEDAERALKENRTYDSWQEGFLSIFNMIKKDLYNVLEEAADGMVVRDEDKAFIANFYKYGFVGLVLEWIDGGMKEEPKVIIDRLNSLIQGSFNHALNNAKVNK